MVKIMSVLEYAEDVNKSVAEILKMCARLSIDAKGEDDYLDEEAITILDNDIAASEETEDLEYEDELIEKENSKIEEIVNNSKPKKGNKQNKNKGAVNKSGKKELAKKKKKCIKIKRN